MKPLTVQATDVSRVRDRFSQNVTANRLIQVSALACLHHVTLTWGLGSIDLETWADLARLALEEVQPGSAGQLLPDLVADLAATSYPFGRVDSGVLHLDRPVKLEAPGSKDTLVDRLASTLLDRHEGLLAQRWPRPVLHIRALADSAQKLQQLNERLSQQPKTYFVGTAGVDRQEIRDRISSRVNQVRQRLDLMMAYVKPEEGIISLRALILRLLASDQLVVRMLLRDQEENKRFVNALIDELRITAAGIGKRDLVDSAQDRIRVRFAPKIGDTHLHAKLWIFDENAVVISSANLLSTSMLSNYEAGVYSEDEALVHDARLFFEDAWARFRPGSGGANR